MSSLCDTQKRMQSLREKTLQTLMNVSEEEMVKPVQYGERSANVRYMFYRLVDHEIEHTVHLIKTFNSLGLAQTEAHLILKNLQEARGTLEGLLIGMTDEDFNKVPSEGEWSPKQVVEHILDTEENYANRIIMA